MFGGGTLKKELERLEKELKAKQSELDSKQSQLAEREAQLDEEKSRAAAGEQSLQEAEARLEALRKERVESHVERSEAQAAADEAIKKLNADVRESTQQLGQNRLVLEEKQKALDVVEDSKAALEKQLAEARRKLESVVEDQAATHEFLDVTIGECEFANAFAYSIAVNFDGDAQRHTTDVAAPSERPTFKRASFLLTAGMDVKAKGESEGRSTEVHSVLKLSAFVHVRDPTVTSGPESEAVVRMLGEAKLPLGDLLSVPDGIMASRRVVRSVNFLRTAAGSVADLAAKPLTVGRATVVLQLKLLAPSEAAASSTQKAAAAFGATEAPLPPSCPSLDTSLWVARPLQRCFRVLLHRAEGLPPPPAEGSGRATARAVLRLMRQDGQVLYESGTSDVAVPAPLEGTYMSDTTFNQEIVVPLPVALQRDAYLQLTLEMISSDSSSGGAAHVACLLDLQWNADVLPVFTPMHLIARPSPALSTVPSAARPRPSLLLSLLAESPHEDLDALGEGISHCVELRLHGTPVGRPLPFTMEGAMVAVCPGAGAHSAKTSSKIPVATFLYDQRMDLSTFIASNILDTLRSAPAYFLSPAVGPSHTPRWNQYVVRCLASLATLSSLTLMLFDCGRATRGMDMALGDEPIAFATLDASALVPRSAPGAPISDPLHRAFNLDLRLIADPGAAASLEVECRLWPRGGLPASMRSDAGPAAQAASLAGSPGLGRALATRETGATTLLEPTVGSPISANAGAASFAGMKGGGTQAGAAAEVMTASLVAEAKELRLSHEISVQLSKEFNMRAVALKKAGEEIVALRRQVQLMQHENARLKAQIEDEEKLAEEIRNKPIPEGLETLSSAELAQKLHRALEKYREEKTKVAELANRLEEALRETTKGRGLQRALEELEQAHLEQNQELQRLQEEGKKLETYRQTTKTQEKVIVKLEKILEGSLAEVQKAQRVQVDVERLKTENLRLREKCANLVARRKGGGGSGGADLEDLRRQVGEKEGEIVRLEGMVRDLQGSSGQPVRAEQESQRLKELEESRIAWEQRCMAAEQRLQMIQSRIDESSRKYGGEIASLKVEVAKRDAKILELEYLLGGSGAGGIANPGV
eukprot:TRINITY_DN48556_c0_g1_i1.p1 TRINITY_DN48556_c0_g1~~TRINITY_DN48556_c0_g1_i1.p1  ORF type:complete len:1103 (-),score=317.49 TRINITY_DN48556_c0_g1_i1:83-3391(-)